MSDDTKPTQEPNEDEESITVKDRRLLTESERTGDTAPESEPQPEPEPEASEQSESTEPETPDADEATAADDDTQAETGAELPDPTVDDVLGMCLAMLHNHAWQSLGLQVSPASGKLRKDLAEARVAIDSLEGLVEQLAKRLPPKEANELRGMLSDLRVNYVQQQSAG